MHFSRGIDSLSALLAAGATTSTIDLGAGVVPIYPRHPVALAQQAATVQSLLGGRLTLGIGVSHQPVMEGMFGLPFARPAAYLREYLAVLVPMLQTGKARFDGEFVITWLAGCGRWRNASSPACARRPRRRGDQRRGWSRRCPSW